ARRGCGSHAHRARAQGLRDTMRAQVFHGPGDLRFEDVPWPTPGPGEIVVKIEAALTCGSDEKVLRRGHPVMIPHVPTVFGHGLLGCLLAMVAASRKARVIIIGKAGWRFSQVQGLRIREFLDATTTADVVAEVKQLTRGRGADVTVDATGVPEVWEQAVAATGRGGTVVFFGGCAPGTTVRLDTRQVHYDELTLVGAFHHTPDLIRRAVDLLESETLDTDGRVTHRMGLADVGRALDLMSRGEAWKVLIEP